MDEVLERADQVTALSKNWPLILNTNGQFDAAEIVVSLLKSNAELKNSVTQLRGERDYLSDSADAALASLDQAGYPTDTYAGIAAGIDALDSELRDTDKSQLEHKLAEEVVRNADLVGDLAKARNVIEQVRTEVGSLPDHLRSPAVRRVIAILDEAERGEGS